MPRTMSDDRLHVAKAYIAGNFDNAYVSETLIHAMSQRQTRPDGTVRDSPFLCSLYTAAYILGFFATYEPHEVPIGHHIDYQQAYDSPTGVALRAMGYMDTHPVDTPKDIPLLHTEQVVPGVWVTSLPNVPKG